MIEIQNIDLPSNIKIAGMTSIPQISAIGITDLEKTYIIDVDTLELKYEIYWGENFLSDSYNDFNLLVNKAGTEYVLLKGDPRAIGDPYWHSKAVWSNLKGAKKNLIMPRGGYTVTNVKYIWESNDLYLFNSLGIPVLKLFDDHFKSINHLKFFKEFPKLKPLTQKPLDNLYAESINVSSTNGLFLGGIYTNIENLAFEYFYSYSANDAKIIKYHIPTSVPNLYQKSKAQKHLLEGAPTFQQLLLYKEILCVVGERTIWFLENKEEKLQEATEYSIGEDARVNGAITIEDRGLLILMALDNSYKLVRLRLEDLTTKLLS